MGDLPTTRAAFALPCSDAAEIICGTVDAAIFVMLMEDVFEARMASGRNSAASSPKIFCFRDNFSETAYKEKIN